MKEIAVTKHGHIFKFAVLDSGKIECSIDNGKTFAVKELKDGKVSFAKKQEIVLYDDQMEIDNVKLNDEDFLALKEAQEATMSRREEKSAAKTPKKASVPKKANSSTNAREAAQKVDAWKRKRSTVKGNNGRKQEYFIHDFRIGDNKYRFLEREIPGVGVVINPDYKISEEMPDVGAIPKQYGELMFWNYYFEGEGWKRVRQLTNNELICLKIIQQHGAYAGQKDQA